ncbi:formylglycine-generating enzyme family protein [bacterium]|nr:formylglycine-generating enzyme family protein [bacterium]
MKKISVVFLIVLSAIALVTMICCSSRQTSGLKTEVIQGITMVTVPAGSFQMGYDYVSDSVPGGKVNVYYPDEQPVHTVTLSPFQISSTEITQALYASVMKDNPSTFTGDDSLPVTNVSANDVLRFCNKLSEAAGFEPCCDEKTGTCDFTKNGFRLPTEAEWEYSCRAGTKTHYSAGNTEQDLDKAGWYIGNSGGRTHPVGGKEPNAWGLYDMHGNVFEFCYDGFDETYNSGNYSKEPVTDPRGCSNFNLRITRGGGWFSEPSVCRSAARSCFWTGGGNYYIGFRVARSVK